MLLWLIIIGCLVLVYFPSAKINRMSLEISGNIISATSLVFDVIADNVNAIRLRLAYFRNLETENMRLRLELAEFKALKIDVSRIQSENKVLRELLNVADDSKYQNITARLAGVSDSPFSNSAIIEAGEDQGVRQDDLVISPDGLIGRVANTSSGYSSVILLSDPNSRVPAITSSSKERGILAKQGNSMLLIYLPERHNVQPGELIYSSGDGKIYPYGLLIGRVAKVEDGQVFVDLSAKLNTVEFVGIRSRTISYPE
jgi:rod shape-determining protein MreC